ncbi:hypothetical protein EVAR_32184_1 [Eumeta japonica]|uniref:Uncharacterized protein n=1 Tax=Eumeta variegata TaxID=151549 RepID=A0A4C1VX79_EUMVA|nr:hypothetical protein EVAR_32184_1 [Eumeta japonica]
MCVEWCIRQLLANRHLVKLGLIKKSERKRCPSFDRRHTARNPPYRKKRAHREERQPGFQGDNEHANHQRIGDHRRQWRLSDSEELLVRCRLCMKEKDI